MKINTVRIAIHQFIFAATAANTENTLAFCVFYALNFHLTFTRLLYSFSTHLTANFSFCIHFVLAYLHCSVGWEWAHSVLYAIACTLHNINCGDNLAVWVALRWFLVQHGDTYWLLYSPEIRFHIRTHINMFRIMFKFYFENGKKFLSFSVKSWFLEPLGTA